WERLPGRLGVAADATDARRPAGAEAADLGADVPQIDRPGGDRTAAVPAGEGGRRQRRAARPRGPGRAGAGGPGGRSPGSGLAGRRNRHDRDGPQVGMTQSIRLPGPAFRHSMRPTDPSHSLTGGAAVTLRCPLAAALLIPAIGLALADGPRDNLPD